MAKLNGTELMMQSLLKAMGVGPDVLAGYIEQGKTLATEFVTSMQQMRLLVEAQNALLNKIHVMVIEKLDDLDVAQELNNETLQSIVRKQQIIEDDQTMQRAKAVAERT